MELVTNIYHKEDYNLALFKRTFFGFCIMPPLHHSVLGRFLNGRKIMAALEAISQASWQGANGLWGNQITTVTLENDDVTRLMLLKSPEGDKLILALMGDAKSVDVISLAYIGSEARLKQYLKVLNIPEMTVYANAYHVSED